MPFNYIDRDLGGIANSGTYPDSRPQVNVAGAINSIAQAYNNTKEGVLTRAMMQAQNARANTELGLHQQEMQLSLAQAGWHPVDETSPTTAAPQAPTPGPIAAAINNTAPTQAPPPSSGMAPPPVAAPLQGAPGAGPAIPGRLNPVALPAPVAAAAGAPTSAGDGSVAAGPGAVIGASAPVSTRAVAPAAPTAPRMTFGGKTYELGLTPQMQREINVRKQSLLAANDAYARDNPGASPLFSPAEIEYGSQSDRVYNTMSSRAEAYQQKHLDFQSRKQDLQGATGADGKPLTDTQLNAIARDPILYRTFTQNQLTPKEQREDPVAVHKQERDYDIDHPTREGAEDPTEKRIDSYVTKRVMQLTASQPPNVQGGTRQPGMDFESAQAQAEGEAQKLYGKKGGSPSPAMPPAPAPSTADPQAAQADFAQAAALYQQALKQPGADPDKVRQAYDAAVTALSRKHGLMK